MKRRTSFAPVLRVAAYLLIATSLVACLKSAQAEVLTANQPRLTPDASSYADIQSLAAGNNEFAFDLYGKLRDSEENLFYSGYSISQALAMVFAGARGQTASQMAETLHFALPQERLHAAFNALDRTLASRAAVPAGKEKTEAPFELRVANAIWAQPRLPYRAEFLTTLAQHYGAGLRLVDIKADPQTAVKRINAWVNKETQERIPEILRELDPNTQMVLTNAIYFNAEWQSPFKESATYSEPFYLLARGEQSVPMMHQESGFQYMQGDGYQAIQLPYMNQEVAMLIILPEKGGFRKVEQRLDNELIQSTVGGLERAKVVLTMPKFRFDANLPLDKTLQDMGMTDAFQPGADFSGLVDPKDYWVWIGRVMHKAFVDVNEERTEAAAATKVEVMIVEKGIGQPEPPPIVMKINRPFIFVIRDGGTNAILFVGRVMNVVQ